MKIAVIICEYNPMQNGHCYHIAKTAEQTACDKTVCIMSGNFTQRGEAAVADKYTRATWAIKSGVDLVVELPPQYVLTSAEYFASGAIKIANTIRGDLCLSFGSESGNFDALREIAEYEESPLFKSKLLNALKQGNGYAKSYSMALEDISPDYRDIIGVPNNILAIEYIKAIKKINPDIHAVTVTRTGGGYNDKSCQTTYPSASAIRHALINSSAHTVRSAVPAYVFDYLKDLNSDELTSVNDKLFTLLKYSAESRDLTKIHGVKEGIQNRIIKSLKSCADWQEFFASLTTKRYTDAYLRRTLLNILIDNVFRAEDLLCSPVNYVNILAMGQNGKDLLSAFKCDVKTRSSAISSDDPISVCDSLYSVLRGNFPKSMQIVNK